MTRFDEPTFEPTGSIQPQAYDPPGPFEAALWPFTERVRCRKCDEISSTVRYHAPLKCRQLNNDDELAPVAQEHLHYTCKNCGHSWMSEPKTPG